jgi:hypothetical protein
MSEGLYIDNIYYIPINTTQFPTGGVCCLGRNISAHACHLLARFLVIIILSCPYSKFVCKASKSTSALYTVYTTLYIVTYKALCVTNITGPGLDDWIYWHF